MKIEKWEETEMLTFEDLKIGDVFYIPLASSEGCGEDNPIIKTSVVNAFNVSKNKTYTLEYGDIVRRYKEAKLVIMP